MADLKRLPVKYIRDRAKSAYEKGTECYICGDRDDLDFHHFYSINELFLKWCRKNSHIISSAEDIIDVRDDFIEDHYKELYVDTVTLCKYHHRERLHKIYGKSPALGTAQKQKRWCDKQRDKVK